MALSFVNNSTEANISAGTTGSVNYTPSAAGNLLLIAVYCTSGSFTFTGSDGTNTYVTDVAKSSATPTSIAIISTVTSVNTLLTIAVGSSGSANYRFRVFEFAPGATGTWSLEDSDTIDESATTSHTSGSTSGHIRTAGTAVVITANCAPLTLNTRTAGSTVNSESYTFPGSAGAQGFCQWVITSAALTSDEHGPWTSTGTARPTAGGIAAYKFTPSGGLDPAILMNSLGGNLGFDPFGGGFVN